MKPVPPGAYLAARRRAARLSIDDLALRIETDPPISHRARGEMIAAIEGSDAPVTADYVAVLRPHLRFDGEVLDQLLDLSCGADLPHPRLCRHCCCSERDACIERDGLGCTWIDRDLCSRCADAAATDAIALPIPAPAAPIGAAA